MGMEQIVEVTASLVGQQIGNYQITRLLGEGGMGQVYLAQHPTIGRQVAIKVLAAHMNQVPLAAKRFEAEARAVTMIDHPNVIEIYDYGRTDQGSYYFVMEVLKGRELTEVIEEKGRMRAVELLPYLRQICGALHAAHEKGVIHRDLKPENIFVLERKPLTIKILDFGLAKLLESEAGPGVTRSGMVVGTPLFIAPEQAAGTRDQICPQTDIYSLGVILYCMLCGEPPFYSEAPGIVMAMHLREEPPPLVQREPTVPQEVARLVHQCLAKRPSDRPVSALDVSLRFALAMGYEAQAGLLSGQELPVTGPEVAVPLSESGERRSGRGSDQSAALAVTQAGTPANMPSVSPSLARPASHSSWRWIAGLALFLALLGAAVYFGARLASDTGPAVARNTALQSKPDMSARERTAASAGDGGVSVANDSGGQVAVGRADAASPIGTNASSAPERLARVGRPARSKNVRRTTKTRVVPTATEPPGQTTTADKTLAPKKIGERTLDPYAN
jgi:serine/threonine protein kinase